MTTTKVLDHGYVRLVDFWGRDIDDPEVEGDAAIIAAARMSTDKGFLGWEPGLDPQGKPHDGDAKLLKFLYEKRHMGPFEFCGLTLEIQAPILVFREWQRHRTQSYNEMSARYTPLPDLNYVPSIERLMMISKTNKQAGGVADAAELTEDVAADLMTEERALNAAVEAFYQKKLRLGVSKELARTHLGVSRYSRMRATGNLRNWLAFLTLRHDKAAQWEIQQYAAIVAEIIRWQFHRTYALFAASR